MEKMVFKKKGQDQKICYIIFWTLIMFLFIYPSATIAEPLIVQSMKTTMYEYVADDEEIDIVTKWIAEGAKNDNYFNEEVLTIMEYDCQNCHSATSTMSKAAPDKPLMTYEEVIQYIQEAPAK
jgi:hypothetical protein